MGALDDHDLHTTFLSDTSQNLDAIEAGAIALDRGAGIDSDAMEEALRHAHTLRGNAASMACGEIAELADVLEEMLHRLRDRRLPDQSAILSVVLQMIDSLRSIAKSYADKWSVDWRCAEERSARGSGGRMVPLATLFRQCARVARDAAASEGKLVELSIVGGDVEVDARAMEVLREALTHMIRNAVAHGIESPRARIAAGKPEQGTLSLIARLLGDGVMVELSDDGNGIQYERVRARAVELGWLREHDVASRQRLDGFLFRSGFSTSDKVTTIAGRGVGMDVVAKRVSSLRGQVLLESSEGRGTCVRLKLPQSIAVIDGFSVTVGDQTLMLPLESVERCVAGLRVWDGAPRGMVEVSGEMIPFVRLRNLLGLGGSPKAREHLVIVQHGGGRAGLAVDGIVGSSQALMRPLGSLYRSGGGATGAAVMPSGGLALVLDVPAIFAWATQDDPREMAS